MKTIQYTLLGLIAILAGCTKDQKEPQSLEYFYTKERTTLLTEEFISNSNNWSLKIDTTYVPVDSAWYDPSISSKAQMSNGDIEWGKSEPFNFEVCDGLLHDATIKL